MAKRTSQETKTRYVEAPHPDETRASQPEPADWELPEPGESIGRYDLESELGRGGMGVVYKAYDPALKRRIALKLLRPELTPASVGRFVEEAQVAAQLQHPGILSVYDVERTEEGGIFYTMQLVQGQTLEALIGGPASLAEEQRSEHDLWTRFKLLQAFVTVCRAVSYAHGRGVIHRDLKPSNVMIGPFAEVYLMDWGVAKILGSAPRPQIPFDVPIEATRNRMATRDGTIVGTPAYMAPEQARGEEVGRAADIYCLGGILYQILTGESPRTGSADDVVAELTRREPSPPPSPRSLRPDVPAELEELCLRALSPDPDDRPPSAGALADTVQAYLEGRSLRAANPEDLTFLSTYSTLSYRRPSIAVDVVLLDRRPGLPVRVYLLRRQGPPFANTWACPGSFVGLDEPLDVAARRVLREKLGYEASVRLVQLGAYGDPHRDPRTRVVSIGYLALLARTNDVPPEPGERGAWFGVRLEEGEVRLDGGEVRLEEGEVRNQQGEPLAFDHTEIIEDALRRSS